MIRMAKLVRQGRNIGWCAAICHKDAGFLALREGDTESARPFCRTVFDFNPIVVEGMLSEIRQLWTKFAELCNNVFCCFFVRDFAGGFADRSFDIDPGQCIFTKHLGFALQIGDESRFVPGNDIPHHIKRRL
ncbi:hypothetical protein D3C73_1102060 [compost metagenome]